MSGTLSDWVEMERMAREINEGLEKAIHTEIDKQVSKKKWVKTGFYTGEWHDTKDARN